MHIGAALEMKREADVQGWVFEATTIRMRIRFTLW